MIFPALTVGAGCEGASFTFSARGHARIMHSVAGALPASAAEAEIDCAARRKILRGAAADNPRLGHR
jgi:hypothetical protein